MSVSRTQLGRGPAKVTYGGNSFYTRDDLVPRHAPVWNPVMTSMYGEIDKVKTDLVIKVPLRLWGAWENLTTLFPSALMNPTRGTELFSSTNAPLVVLGRNGDQITYTTAMLTKVADLYLGVDSDLFAADVEFTSLLGNSTGNLMNPEDAGAYYTLATAQAYTDSDFAKTNFKRTRFTGAWAAKTGFTSFVSQDGFKVGWDLQLKPLKLDGYGTVGMGIDSFRGSCKAIPVGPTLAQIEALSPAAGSAHGTLLSAGAADLTLSGTGISVVLKNASMVESGYVFGVEKLRVGEMGWETTRGFTAGVPAAIATVA